jgi:hypothetical protein
MFHKPRKRLIDSVNIPAEEEQIQRNPADQVSASEERERTFFHDRHADDYGGLDKQGVLDDPNLVLQRKLEEAVKLIRILSDENQTLNTRIQELENASSSTSEQGTFLKSFVLVCTSKRNNMNIKSDRRRLITRSAR